jgi:hypothetical protein
MTEQSDRKYTREQIFAKITKLMNIANDQAANENLAASAAAKAQEMMQQWAITETELAAASGQSNPVKYSVETVAQLLTKRWPWESWLSNVVGLAFFTHPVQSDRNKNFSFCGREEDAKMAAFMFSQLRTTLDRLAREAFQRHAEDYKKRFGASVYKRSNAQAYRGKWLTSWMDGAVAVVGKRLKEQNQRFAESSSTALVIVETRAQEAHQHALTVFPSLRPGKSSRLTLFQEAQLQGRAAGATVALNKGLTAQPSAKQFREE